MKKLRDKLNLPLKLYYLIMYTFFNSVSVASVPLLYSKFLSSQHTDIEFISQAGSAKSLGMVLGILLLPYMYRKISTSNIVYISLVLKLIQVSYFILTYDKALNWYLDLSMILILGLATAFSSMTRSVYLDTFIKQSDSVVDRRFGKYTGECITSLSIVLILFSFDNLKNILYLAFIFHMISFYFIKKISIYDKELSPPVTSPFRTIKIVFEELNYSLKLKYVFILNVLMYILLAPASLIYYMVTNTFSEKTGISYVLITLLIYVVDILILKIVYKSKDWFSRSYLSLSPLLILVTYLLAVKFTSVLILIPMFFASRLNMMFLDRSIVFHARKDVVGHFSLTKSLIVNLLISPILIIIGKVLKSMPFADAMLYFSIATLLLIIPLTIILNAIFPHTQDTY